MSDVEEIIDYLKSLKKGFDKDLFQSKIDDLGYLVDNSNINYDEFHTLFKIWLNLNIPITKWTNLGTCLVPHSKISQKTIDFSLRWILANYKKQNNVSRVGFLLDWLTAAMDCDSIDMNALDYGYELFYVILTCETLTGNAMKIVYTLTKPSDVTRRRVLELIEYAKKREGKKNLFKQLQVLLGLFKSYKPECVPEQIPSISIHTAFKKINSVLLSRFKNFQCYRNNLQSESQRVFWTTNVETSRNKKIEPLVPNMFVNVGTQNAAKMPKKNYLDFSDPVSLLQYSLNHYMSRPARLRAFLCNEVGITQLIIASDNDHAFLSHDLHHILNDCFLDVSGHSYTEKRDMLHRLVILQSTFMQGLPVITKFLAQFLPFWNESDFFPEILQLVEWVNVEEVAHVQVILEMLSKIYHRSQPMEQCALLRSITTMYTNLVKTSTRSKQHFLSVKPSTTNFSEVLNLVASKISDLCNNALQTMPKDMRVVYSCTVASVRVTAASAAPDAMAAAAACVQVGTAPLSLALPLLAPSAILFDNMAALLSLYKQIIRNIKGKNILNKQDYINETRLLKSFTMDLVGCLHEDYLHNQKLGLVFSKLHPQLISKLKHLIPDVESKLSIRNHIAFAPYTYLSLLTVDDGDNKLGFKKVIETFTNIGPFVKDE